MSIESIQGHGALRGTSLPRGWRTAEWLLDSKPEGIKVTYVAGKQIKCEYENKEHSVSSRLLRIIAKVTVVAHVLSKIISHHYRKHHTFHYSNTTKSNVNIDKKVDESNSIVPSRSQEVTEISKQVSDLLNDCQSAFHSCNSQYQKVVESFRKYCAKEEEDKKILNYYPKRTVDGASYNFDDFNHIMLAHRALEESFSEYISFKIKNKDLPDFTQKCEPFVNDIISKFTNFYNVSSFQTNEVPEDPKNIYREHVILANRTVKMLNETINERAKFIADIFKEIYPFVHSGPKAFINPQDDATKYLKKEWVNSLYKK